MESTSRPYFLWIPRRVDELVVRDVFPHTCTFYPRKTYICQKPFFQPFSINKKKLSTLVPFTPGRPTSAPWPFLQLWRTNLILEKLFFRALLILEQLLFTLVSFGRPFGCIWIVWGTLFYPIWYVYDAFFLCGSTSNYHLLFSSIECSQSANSRSLKLYPSFFWDNCHTQRIYKRNCRIKHS